MDIIESTGLVMFGAFGAACLLTAIFTFHIFWEDTFGNCSFYESMEKFRKKYKPNKWIWIIASIIMIISFSINLANSPTTSTRDNDKGYWGTDGYYHPTDREMDQYIRDAKEWIDNN